MKLSRVFSLDLLYDKAWKKYAAKAGIEDPWVRAREKQNEIKGEEDTIKINGTDIPCIN